MLVTFAANWCYECDTMIERLKNVESLLKSKSQLVVLDWEKDRKKAQELNVFGIPTTLIIYEGSIKEKIYGVISQKATVELVQKYL